MSGSLIWFASSVDLRDGRLIAMRNIFGNSLDIYIVVTQRFQYDNFYVWNLLVARKARSCRGVELLIDGFKEHFLYSWSSIRKVILLLEYDSLDIWSLHFHLCFLAWKNMDIMNLSLSAVYLGSLASLLIAIHGWWSGRHEWVRP